MKYVCASCRCVKVVAGTVGTASHRKLNQNFYEQQLKMNPLSVSVAVSVAVAVSEPAKQLISA